MSQSFAPPLHQALQLKAEPGESAEERALAGRPDGWNELVRKHNRRLVLVLLARGIRPDTARDLAQEAWTRLIKQQRLGRLFKIRMPGLVIKQALFLARDHARLDKSLQSTTSAKGSESEAVDPLPRLWARERLQQARQALNRCSTTEQRIFHALHDSSAHDVARQMSLSVQRVRQIQCEVRKKLRHAMKGLSHEQ